MPTYEFRCPDCTTVAEFTMTVKERFEKALPACPKCGGKRLEPVFGQIYAKTSRKS